MERVYDLKRADGRVVTWTGSSGEDAARRYVDCVRPGVAIVATREHEDAGVTVLGRGVIVG